MIDYESRYNISSPDLARLVSFGGNLLECVNSLQEKMSSALNGNEDWKTSSAYNAGQAVSLLELSGYSFHMTSDEIFKITIYKSFRAEMHYVSIDPIKSESDRVEFEQGRYDALMEVLNSNNLEAQA